MNPLMIDEEKTVKEFSESFEKSGIKKVVISEEGLFGNAFYNFNNQQVIAQTLKKLFHQPKIIIVLRRQDTYLESRYKQLLHQGMSLTINRFLNYKKGKFLNYEESYSQYPNYFSNIDVYQHDYHKMVIEYFTIFGKENVLVLPYEMIKKDKVTFLTKVQNFMGLTSVPTVQGKPSSNRSYSLLTAYLALIFNRFLLLPFNQCGFIPQNPFADYFVKHREKSYLHKMIMHIVIRANMRWLLTQFDKIFYIPHSFIDKKKRNKILDIHRESNRELAKEIGIDLSVYGYFESKQSK